MPTDESDWFALGYFTPYKEIPFNYKPVEVKLLNHGRKKMLVTMHVFFLHTHYALYSTFLKTKWMLLVS